MPRHWSETVAKDYLVERGYTLLTENYTVRGGEVDLVMRDGESVVFVEVRQRKTARYGSAAASITPQKMTRLRKTALHYLVTTFGHDDVLMRFDAVLIEGVREKFKLEHLKNIF